MFEHHSQPLLPRDQFVSRLAQSGGLALALVMASLFSGMIGYHTLELLHRFLHRFHLQRGSA